MNHNTTLKKISEILDISISTVSRALKDHPDIADKTKQKVKELAGALEYEPNTHAISLRSGSSRIMAILVPYVSNYFYDSFIASIEEDCRKKNYSLMVLQSGDDPATEAENLKLCKLNRVSGLFVCITPNTTDTLAFEKLPDAGIPLIFFDKVPDGDFYTACLADEKAAQTAADYILQRDKKNVLALFGNKQLSITQKRLAAFLSVFESKEHITIHTGFAHSFQEAYQAFLQQFACEDKPDAVFCMSDEILTGVMKAVQQLQLKVPADLAIISLSNGFIPTLYYPDITYVETSGYKLGKLAFIQMLELINGNNTEKNIMLDAILVEGGSF